MNEQRTLSDLVGKWEEPAVDSGLIARCRAAWTKPIGDLTRAELATLLRQKIAAGALAPIGRKKLAQGDDGTEMYEGELAAAIEYAERAQPDARDQRAP